MVNSPAKGKDMNKLILITFIFSIFNTVYAASCRRQVKNCRYKVGQAQMSLDKAADYYDRSENFILKRKFDMAKKYIDLSIERIETALVRFEIANKELEETLQNCPRRDKRINGMINEVYETSEEMKFRKMILGEISQRL